MSTRLFNLTNVKKSAESIESDQWARRAGFRHVWWIEWMNGWIIIWSSSFFVHNSDALSFEDKDGIEMPMIEPITNRIRSACLAFHVELSEENWTRRDESMRKASSSQIVESNSMLMRNESEGRRNVFEYSLQWRRKVWSVKLRTDEIDVSVWVCDRAEHNDRCDPSLQCRKRKNHVKYHVCFD